MKNTATTHRAITKTEIKHLLILGLFFVTILIASLITAFHIYYIVVSALFIGLDAMYLIIKHSSKSH